jgi:tetratricopeptide (TPR) repeat protein
MDCRLRLVLASAALVTLAGCATAPAGTGSTAAGTAVASAPSDKASILGLYLAGHAALDAGDSQAAAEYFAKAKSAEPEASFLKERAFTSALLAGDVTAAAAMAPGPGEGAPASQVLGLLAQGVEALALGRGGEAWTKLSQSVPGSPPTPAGVLLKPWAAAAAGRATDAVTVPASGDRLVSLTAGMNQALLFERARRYDEAETAYKALLSRQAGKGLIGPAYAQFLERRGRRPEALAVYDDLLSQDGDDPVLISARARAASKGAAPPAPTLREGAAQSLMIPAAAALGERQPQLALIYLRLAVRLDPKRDDAWLLAGDVMNASGDEAAARAAFERIQPKSIRYPDARGRLAWSYQQAGEKETALKLARETLQLAPASDAARLTLADLLRINQQFDESARTLDPLIQKSGAKAEWRLYYMRAVALERSGHWPEAQSDFNKALAMKPDQPEILNYLGYSWVNRGERVQEGMALIQRAVDAQPEEGAYVDSLGWALYRTGDYAKAVQTLERAVSLDAGDAEINDHLGDAYWRVGRRDEARFQWKAVLTLKPDEDIRARAETKLASPSGADAVAAPVQAP